MKELINYFRYQQDKTLMILLKKPLDVSYFIYSFNRYLNLYLNVASKKKAQLPPMESKPSSEDILNAILPPREWVENGTFIQI